MSNADENVRSYTPDSIDDLLQSLSNFQIMLGVAVMKLGGTLTISELDLAKFDVSQTLVIKHNANDFEFTVTLEKVEHH